MEKWTVAGKKADFAAWSEQFHISPVLARIIRNRDVTTLQEVETFLHGDLSDCPSPFLLQDMDKAVATIKQAISEHIAIRVIGDYDVDGICASYILTKGLRLLGADVDTVIPHRVHDGYGLNDGLITQAHQDGIGMIVTCDNGIAASKQIALANSLGLSVVVTDHHEVPFREEEDGTMTQLLPPALAVVDPKRQDCGYPYSEICGGLVAYKLIQAMNSVTETKIPDAAMEELLEFAALATVCDVMELRGENRIIVKEGLKRMKQSANLGLRALMQIHQIEADRLSTYHLGFVIGPCLNATGRLDTANRSLELLFSSTNVEAMQSARELKELNDSRKNLTQIGVEEAEEYIQKYGIEKDNVMVVFCPGIHESLAGIVASRLKEKYYRPVFLLTKGEEGVKGSARSIEGYHMFHKMSEIASLFTKFGGHAMAAGFSMEEEDIPKLRRQLNEKCGLTEEDFIANVKIDVPMPLGYADFSLAEQLELLEPHGVGNPKPLFAEKNVTFLSGRKLGANANVGKYQVRTEDGKQCTLMYFGNLDNFDRYLEEKFGPAGDRTLYMGGGQFQLAVAYHLGINEYKGKKELQFVMQNYK